ncbi:MAG: hypothetical protein DHS20C13_14300 [Thermodesulfobacteriota bacterium]|nr:MAG: hypothetical protein DHS20C13_14300 [Thermodesulfobacteriota bacterium]
MASHRRRIRAMQSLIAGTPCFSGQEPTIINEYQDVYLCRRIRSNKRKLLLQLLHSTRALDTSLKNFVTYHNCNVNGNSLGSYLRSLIRPHHHSSLSGSLTRPQVDYFQDKIVNKRNHYVHEAGAFPSSDREIEILLNEMQNCLTIVLAL